MGKSQRSKRARKHRKQAKFSGLQVNFGHPSQLSGSKTMTNRRAKRIMTDQVICKNEDCKQPIYVERGGRSVIACQSCLTVWFVRYAGDTIRLHNIGTKQATERTADEKKAPEV